MGGRVEKTSLYRACTKAMSEVSERLTCRSRILPALHTFGLEEEEIRKFKNAAKGENLQVCGNPTRTL